MTRLFTLGLLTLGACGGRQAARDEATLDRIGWLEGRWTETRGNDSGTINVCWDREPGRMRHVLSMGEMVHRPEREDLCTFVSVEPDGDGLAAYCGRLRRRVELEVGVNSVRLVDPLGGGFEYERRGPDTLSLSGMFQLHRNAEPCVLTGPHP